LIRVHDDVVAQVQPCPYQLFYAIIRHFLELGRQITVTTTRKVTTRRLEETDFKAIESFCNFSNFHKSNGYLNSRKSKRKASVFYHVILRFIAEHTQKNGKEYATFYLVIGALNPAANTIFPAAFEKSESNLNLMQRYLRCTKNVNMFLISHTSFQFQQYSQNLCVCVRSFPIRLRKDGYDVSDSLISICKAHAQPKKKAKAAAAGGNTSQ
jgi:hypothetical protein